MSYLQRRLEALNRQLHRNMIGMKPLAKGHHTTGDWDFANASWELSSAYYISPPSSLHLTANGNNAKVKTTKVPIANVKEGRVITQMQGRTSPSRTELVFRWQDNDNYYCANLTFYSPAQPQYIYRRQGGVNTVLKNVTKLFYTNSWYKFRLTWWNDAVGLVIRLEQWNGSQWVQVFSDSYDSLNLWKDTGGRIGMGDFAISTVSGNMYYDDTEIYGIPA